MFFWTIENIIPIVPLLFLFICFRIHALFTQIILVAVEVVSIVIQVVHMFSLQNVVKEVRRVCVFVF
jgi:hypothetical protein